MKNGQKTRIVQKNKINSAFLLHLQVFYSISKFKEQMVRSKIFSRTKISNFENNLVS